MQFFNSVSIAMDYEFDVLGSIPGRDKKNVFFSITLRPVLGPTEPHISIEGCFQGGKEVQQGWSCPSTPPCVFMA
jgi:hypothetical protein